MSLLIKPWVKKNLNISFPVIAVQRTGNWDTLNPLTRYPRQYLLLHTCSSHKGLQQCSLPLLYESPAAEFTDRDRAKCNPISAGINHPALFFGCTICLKQHWFGGRCTMPQKKGEGGGGKEVGQIHVSRTIRTKQIVLSFSVEFTFSLPAATLTPEHNS